MRRSILRSSGIARGLAARLALALAPVILTVSCGFGGSGVSPVRTSFNKGVYHYSHGNLDEAIAEYRLALEENESDRHARFNLAVTLEARARRLREEKGEEGEEAARELELEAEDEYRMLVETSPEFLRAIVNLAACEYDRGERDRARERLEDAIERFPGAALPRVSLATLEFRALREETSPALSSGAAFEVVLTRVDEGLDLDPASVRGNMLRGDVHAELARRARASPSGTSGLGMDAGSHAGAARESYERALLREPGDIATLMALGRLEKEERSWAVAAAFFERVILIDPDHLEARLSLSEVLASAGDLEGATYNLWRARVLDRSRNPRLSPEEYRRRLVELYEQLSLAERERLRKE